MVDPSTDRPLFVTRCIELCCEKCKQDGKSHECVHMLHLVPSWQSEERHRKLKIMMQDRPVQPPPPLRRASAQARSASAVAQCSAPRMRLRWSGGGSVGESHS